MNFNGLIENITNPALLFFILGIFSVQIKSDLKIPESSSRFIAAYLLLAIGFKGGQELAHTSMNMEIISSLGLGLVLSAMIPVSAFFILKRKMNVHNAGAIAAAYGSVSAVTFVTTIAFLESKGVAFGGHMVATMAIMEAPAIVMGVLLAKSFARPYQVEMVPANVSVRASGASYASASVVTQSGPGRGNHGAGSILRHAFTNGSVLLIFGSLLIGLLASQEHAEGIRPFTNDLFKGFLAVFLLDMGITCGKQINSVLDKGVFPLVFAVVMPFVHGLAALFLASLITSEPGNLLLFAILGAGASYIAVPAAMKNSIPESNPSLYLSMALGITFPVNVIIGIPIYYQVITYLV